MRALFTFVFMLSAVIAYSKVSQQTTMIRGQVLGDKKKPIVGANVFLEGTYDGGTTDSLGYFTFESSIKDSATLVVSAISFNTSTTPIRIQQQRLQEPLVVRLSPSQNTIEEVFVKAGEFRVGQQASAALSPLDIVSTAGSMGNIIAALETLPGAQVAGENGRLMVRGGDPHETQTYVNGVRVGQPYTMSGNDVPVRGRFSPMLFQGTNFSTGAYSAEYGNALSSILNLKTAPEPETAKTDLSLSALGLAAARTAAWGNTSLTVNANYLTLGPITRIIPQNLHWITPYQQWSGEGVLRHRTEKQRVNIYTSFSQEKMSFQQAHIDFGPDTEMGVRAKNFYGNATYTRYLPKNWTWDAGVGVGYLGRHLALDTLSAPSGTTDLHIKNKWRKVVNSSIRYFFGLDYFYQQYNERLTAAEIAIPSYGFQNQIAAGYGELSYSPFAQWQLDVGGRYAITNHTSPFLEPRVSLGFQASKQHTVSLSYGLFNQQPAEDIQKLEPNLPWQSARHSIFQYSYFGSGKQLRLELFHKAYQNLVRFDRRNEFLPGPFNTDGHGKVKGVDVFWRDNATVRSLQYWISYSWTHARKLERDYGFAVQPPYVAEHYASIVAKYWISSWRSQVGVTNTLISGRPYHDVNQPGYVQHFTKAINTLSANWSYLITSQKIIHIAVNNVLGNEPIYGYQYALRPNTNGRFDRQAIIPPAKRFVFVGFFWTISSNKTANQLDNL